MKRGPTKARTWNALSSRREGENKQDRRLKKYCRVFQAPVKVLSCFVVPVVGVRVLWEVVLARERKGFFLEKRKNVRNKYTLVALMSIYGKRPLLIKLLYTVWSRHS